MKSLFTNAFAFLIILSSVDGIGRGQQGQGRYFSRNIRRSPQRYQNSQIFRRNPQPLQSSYSTSCPAAFTKAPKSIEVFYDQILSNPLSASQDSALLTSAAANDWNTRPNSGNPKRGIDAGPGLQGLPGLLDFAGQVFNWKYQRQENLVIGNTVYVRSTFKGTIGSLPPGLSEYPSFPGVDPARLTGKTYTALAMDIHVLDEGKIRRSWHFEDYGDILDQILNKRGPTNLEEPQVSGQFLTEVPQSIYNFYDKILQDVNGQGQNDGLLAQTVAENWQSRPNGLDRIGGNGPERQGLKQLLGLYGLIFGDTLKFERRRAYVICDRVIMLGRISGTIQAAPPGAVEVPIFPGIPKEKLIGKSFETIFMDRHIIVDGLIAQTYHVEDWATAATQMLNGTPPPDFGFDFGYLENIDQLGV